MAQLLRVQQTVWEESHALEAVARFGGVVMIELIDLGMKAHLAKEDKISFYNCVSRCTVYLFICMVTAHLYLKQ